MKIRKISSAICAVVALCAVFAAVALAFWGQSADPVLLKTPDAATDTVAAMMDAACSGDYRTAGSYLYGTPDLGADRAPADPVGGLIWERRQSSMVYELLGECYPTEEGLAQDISVTCLDVSSVTVQLRDRSQTMLAQRVQEAEDLSAVYDENHEYREDFVMDALYDAAAEILTEETGTTTVVLTVHLKYEDGQWWVVADNTLLSALFGDVLF